MARKPKTRRRKVSSRLRTRIVLAVTLGTVAVLFAIALLAYLQDGNWRSDPARLAPAMGRVNFWAARVSVTAIGVLGAWVVALALGLASIRLWVGRPLPLLRGRTLAFSAVGVVLAGGCLALPGGELSPERFLFSGWLGAGFAATLRALFGGVGAVVVWLGLVAGFLATVGIPIFTPLARLLAPLGGVGRAAVRATTRFREQVAEAFTPVGDPSGRAPLPRRGGVETEDDPPDEPIVVRSSGKSPLEWTGPGAPAVTVPPSSSEEGETEGEEEEERGSEPAASDVPARANGRTAIPDGVPVVLLPPAGEPEEARGDAPLTAESLRDLPTAAGPYQQPPRNFLEMDEEDGEAEEVQRGALLESAKLLEKTLHSFGVKGKVTQVQPGPVITRYEVEPGPGQKVAPIASLSDDLALALKARSIRIEAPIPGKAAVGIEVPNSSPRMVRLGSLLETSEFTEDESPLTIALGRTISGEPFCVALDRMPHVLVAGATGAGKSVCINTIITSIVYHSGPEDVRFVMIDPKMLELMSYVGMPHVIPPIVTQAKEAAKILKWAVGEMEARYRTLAHVGVRSIRDYNRRMESESASKMPYLVVIVDELADLMLSNQKNEIEDSIARLAQMARAVGIHLVVATQRPSVDVITGVIKANFPSRIAFQVPTRTDSRTILDSIGAEKLLGNGDMLYLGVGMSEPVRVHGSYISTEETNDIVEWLKSRNPAPVQAEENASPLNDGNDLFPMDREDDLFEEASRILVSHQQGSISLLQRRLKVGYARAARLVDMMEEAGIVGPFTGSKAREILVPSVEDLDRLLTSRQRSPLGGKQG